MLSFPVHQSQRIKNGLYFLIVWVVVLLSLMKWNYATELTNQIPQPEFPVYPKIFESANLYQKLLLGKLTSDDLTYSIFFNSKYQNLAIDFGYKLGEKNPYQLKIDLPLSFFNGKIMNQLKISEQELINQYPQGILTTGIESGSFILHHTDFFNQLQLKYLTFYTYFSLNKPNPNLDKYQTENLFEIGFKMH